MAITYKKTKYKKPDGSTAEHGTIQRNNGDGSVTVIPNDPLNRDRITYNEWVAAGNTPEAAD